MSLITVILAARELTKYIEHITGVHVRVRSTARPPLGTIAICRGNSPSEERYLIEVRNASIHLTGARDRSTLYAAYDLLERLGCRWLSPSFDFYGGKAEVAPKQERLILKLNGEVVERPRLKLRKLYQVSWANAARI